VFHHSFTVGYRCAHTTQQITGQPAKYRDPLTGYPYADAAAFKELRKRYGAAAQRKVQLSNLIVYEQSDNLLQRMRFVHVKLVCTGLVGAVCALTQSVSALQCSIRLSVYVYEVVLAFCYSTHYISDTTTYLIDSTPLRPH
jgi:YL1 nuclear protein C-terminal domain